MGRGKVKGNNLQCLGRFVGKSQEAAEEVTCVYHFSLIQICLLRSVNECLL